MMKKKIVLIGDFEVIVMQESFINCECKYLDIIETLYSNHR